MISVHVTGASTDSSNYEMLYLAKEIHKHDVFFVQIGILIDHIAVIGHIFFYVRFINLDLQNYYKFDETTTIKNVCKRYHNSKV